MADTSRVVFPADWNTAVATIQSAYREREEPEEPGAADGDAPVASSD